MANELNVFGDAPQGITAQSVTTAMVTSRQAQEVQAAMIVAKRFPRDERESNDRILRACTRRSLAEAAIYEYSRGGTTVTGPSIRLAECVAQSWGNIDFGYVELEQKGGESQVMAYAWDLETNTRQTKVFTVPHKRHTKNGDYPLIDPRDIYEMVANQASRRVRSCILAIIPGDVIDSAVKQCELTLKAGSNVPLEDRIKDMVAKFAEYEVTPEQLRAFIGKNVEAFSEADIVRLGKVYRSLKDGIVGNDYFLNRMKEAPAEAPQQQAQTPAEPAPADPQPEPQRRRRTVQPVNLDELT